MRRSLLILLLVAPACAADLLPADRPIHAAVDHYVDAQIKDAGGKAAPLADDATLLRRLTLDLAGRIPTASEVAAWLADKSPAKKPKLVERLMATRSFDRHLVNELDTMLAPETGRRGQGNLREYLTKAVKDKRSWDGVFRDLMAADDKARKGSSQFLKPRVRDLDRLTSDVSSLFFGVNISCAQCHDHPLVHDWKQDHYYGLKSFLARSFEQGQHVGERDTGAIQFDTVKKVKKTAKMMFLTGKVIDAPGSDVKPDKGGKRKPAPAKGKGAEPPPPPAWSARAALVEAALAPDARHFFAKSIANRVWHRLFGLGLVAPTDQMHSENAPSHPELLDWLARDTVAHGYDLRRLIKGLALSDAYARASKIDGDKWPAPRLFAVARPRPLTPMQLGLSLRVATAAPAEFAKDPEGRFDSYDGSARGIASQIEYPRDDFQISVVEALLFSNSDRIQREFLADGGDRLVGALKTLKEGAADAAILNVFSRPAQPEEKAAFDAFVSARKDRPAEAYKQAVWALIASAEFRFNH
ncbi:MAG: DUF1549 and DUF1553 domain-containing protein [Gemmataceae bacterium]|nr:DUF1549 and DUF1553 domain-containing protein [Gemmataceae bacterium]